MHIITSTDHRFHNCLGRIVEELWPNSLKNGYQYLDSANCYPLRCSSIDISVGVERNE